MNCSTQSAPGMDLCCKVAVHCVIITNTDSVLLCEAVEALAAISLQFLHRLYASATAVACCLFAQLGEAAAQRHMLMVAEQFTHLEGLATWH